MHLHPPHRRAAAVPSDRRLTLDDSPFDSAPRGVAAFRRAGHDAPAPPGRAAPAPRNSRGPVASALARLRLSGSSQFDAHGLAWLRDQLAPALQQEGCRHLEIVDLREESHGFVGGRAVGFWARDNSGNRGRELPAILVDEAARLAQLDEIPPGTPLAAWHRSHKKMLPTSLSAAPTQTEPQLLAALWCPHPPGPHPTAAGAASGARTLAGPETASRPRLTAAAGASTLPQVGSTRLPMGDGLPVPPDASVDGLLTLVREKLPPGSAVHFHCLHGHGRTSLFMLMYDIVRSAAKLDLDAIVARQRALPDAQAPDTAATRRFLRRLHHYCRATDGLVAPPSWSAWQRAQPTWWQRCWRALCGLGDAVQPDPTFGPAPKLA